MLIFLKWALVTLLMAGVLVGAIWLGYSGAADRCQRDSARAKLQNMVDNFEKNLIPTLSVMNYDVIEREFLSIIKQIESLEKNDQMSPEIAQAFGDLEVRKDRYKYLHSSLMTSLLAARYELKESESIEKYKIYATLLELLAEANSSGEELLLYADEFEKKHGETLFIKQIKEAHRLAKEMASLK